MKIPAEAVEAAALAIYQVNKSGESGFELGDYRQDARAALEAAAPLILAPQTIATVEDLDALPIGSVVRSDMGVVWEKDEYTEEPEFPWWCPPGDSHQYPARRISLPATLIYRPTP